MGKKENQKGNAGLEIIREMFDKFRNSEQYKKHIEKNKKGKETQDEGGYVELRVVETETIKVKRRR